jgi:hypothetical protein
MQIGALRDLKKDMGVRRNVLLQAVVAELERRIYYTAIGEASDSSSDEDETPELSATLVMDEVSGESWGRCRLRVLCALAMLSQAALSAWKHMAAPVDMVVWHPGQPLRQLATGAWRLQQESGVESKMHAVRRRCRSCQGRRRRRRPAAGSPPC